MPCNTSNTISTTLPPANHFHNIYDDSPPTSVSRNADPVHGTLPPRNNSLHANTTHASLLARRTLTTTNLPQHPSGSLTTHLPISLMPFNHSMPLNTHNPISRPLASPTPPPSLPPRLLQRLHSLPTTHGGHPNSRVDQLHQSRPQHRPRHRSHFHLRQ